MLLSAASRQRAGARKKDETDSAGGAHGDFSIGSSKGSAKDKDTDNDGSGDSDGGGGGDGGGD
jgi:hypothetical protein